MLQSFARRQLIRRPVESVAPQRLVARWSAFVLAAFALIGLLPGMILPNYVPLVAVFACAAATLAVQPLPESLHFDLVTPASAFFAAVGIIYIAASMLDILPHDHLRPRRADYVMRHAYYVLPWIPLMAGATLILRNVTPDLAGLARRWGLTLLAGLAVGDVLGAIFFGVPERMGWEGYVPFFDPPTITFVYTLCFFLYVAVTRRIVVPLAIATVHCVLSNAIDYGQMFNTMTGVYVLGCMWLFALGLMRSPAFAFYVVVALGIGLVVGMVAGVAAPAIIGFDINSSWRFLVWRENLFASLSSGLLGVGFGTPYYQLSQGNIGEAFRLMRFAEFEQYAFSSPIDLLYVRGQHSSFVNAFYRMGVLGGGLLTVFNVTVLIVLLRAVRRGGALQPVVAAAGAVFVVEASQIALHVGLESPRYLAVYALAVGLARATSFLAARERPEPPTPEPSPASALWRLNPFRPRRAQ